MVVQRVVGVDHFHHHRRTGVVALVVVAPCTAVGFRERTFEKKRRENGETMKRERRENGERTERERRENGERTERERRDSKGD